MNLREPSQPCPCGSGRAFGDCCGPWLGGAPAPTAAALMRSRYTAYRLGAEDYLLATWHPTRRPARVETAAGPEWLALEVCATAGGSAAEGEGTVEFKARYRECGRVRTLHETSRFVREAGRWFYVDGTIHPTDAVKVGRNDPCPCGGGRKFKQCCGRAGA